MGDLLIGDLLIGDLRMGDLRMGDLLRGERRGDRRGDLRGDRRGEPLGGGDLRRRGGEGLRTDLRTPTGDCLAFNVERGGKVFCTDTLFPSICP